MSQTNDFEHRVSELIEASIATKQSLLGSQRIVLMVAKVSKILVNALKQGNKALLFGNGGSAADAQHIAAELAGRFPFHPPALPALALSVTSSWVSSLVNPSRIPPSFFRPPHPLPSPLPSPHP